MPTVFARGLTLALALALLQPNLPLLPGCQQKLTALDSARVST
jgi:hypothetical protein